MARNFLVPIQMAGNQTLGFRVENLAVRPGAPYGAGHTIFNTATGAIEFYDGATWRNTLARGDATGTQLAVTISDFNAAVRTNRLDQMAAPAANIPMAGFKFTGLPTPTTAGDGAEYSWVLGQVQSAAAGVSSRPPVRLVSTANIATLSGTLTVDGVVTVAGDRVLLTAQTTATQNGVYVVAAGAWARATSEDQANELAAGATWLATEGATQTGSQWRQATTGAIVVGTTNISIVQFAVPGGYTASNGVQLVTGNFSIKLPAASGLVADATGVYLDTTVAVRKVMGTIGDGTAVSYNVLHNLATRDVTVQVYQTGAPYGTVEVDVNRTDANNVAVVFAAAPAAGSYRVVVHG